MTRVEKVGAFALGFLVPWLGVVLYYRYKKEDSMLAQELISGFWWGLVTRVCAIIIIAVLSGSLTTLYATMLS